jgi:hypothetical protein
MESTKHLNRFDGGTRSVYVTNPEMHPEYEILKTSAIYQLSSQPEGARKLTLLPVHQYGRCGNPLMLTIVTFGIVPGVLPGARAFEYDLDTDGVVEHCVHPLPIYDRISIWEWLVRHDDQKVLAEALAWSSLQRRPNKSLQATRDGVSSSASRFTSFGPACLSSGR